MMSADENTPIKATGKNGKAGPPAKKASKRSRKVAQQASPAPEQIEQAQEPIPVVAVAMESPPAEVVPDAPPAAAPAEPAETVPTEPAETAPVSLQTITNAYGDFTRKSIEQTSSFFAQLAGVRSLDQALELQGEFARQSFETFVSETRKIRELHSEMTMQRLHHLEGFVAKMKPTR